MLLLWCGRPRQAEDGPRQAMAGGNMRKMRSSAASAIVRGMALVALVGGVAGAAGAVRAAGVLDGQTIRILAIGDPVFQVMQRIHGQLEEMAGGSIELEVRPFDVLRQQVLLNAQNASSNYDIIAIDLPQFGEYRSFLTDLSPLIQESGFDGSDFHEVAWTGAQFGGQQLGIPIQPHPEILAYRVDLFEEAGLAEPETTDDVLAAAEKLHGSKDGLSGICWNAARGTALGQTFIQVEGAHGQAPIDLPKEGDDFLFDDIQPANMKPMIDTEAGHATANYLQALKPFSPPGILNMAWDERVRVFAQGGCAMTYIWSGRSAIYELDEAAAARGNVDYVPHPSGLGAPRKSTLGGWYLGIPSNLPQDRVPLAWDVIEWLTSAEMMMEYTKHGNCVAPRHSVSQDPEVVERCPVIPHVDQMASSGQLAGWQRPPVPELQQMVDVLGAEMHEMLADKKTPAEAVEESQRLIDRIMIKAGYY
jgi:multiple sugar transport system substrate-binding protein